MLPLSTTLKHAKDRLQLLETKLFYCSNECPFSVKSEIDGLYKTLDTAIKKAEFLEKDVET